jgi:hypothetical protein
MTKSLLCWPEPLTWLGCLVSAFVTYQPTRDGFIFGQAKTWHRNATWTPKRTLRKTSGLRTLALDNCSCPIHQLSVVVNRFIGSIEEYCNAHRKPPLLLLFIGLLLLRYAARRLFALLLFHDPPRNTRGITVTFLVTWCHALKDLIVVAPFMVRNYMIHHVLIWHDKSCNYSFVILQKKISPATRTENQSGWT